MGIKAKASEILDGMDGMDVMDRMDGKPDGVLVFWCKLLNSNSLYGRRTGLGVGFLVSPLTSPKPLARLGYLMGRERVLPSRGRGPN